MSKQTQPKQDGFAHPVLILIVVGCLVVGAGVFMYGQQKADKPLSSASQTDNVSLSSPLPADLLTAAKIKEIAAVEKPGMAIKNIELEKEGEVYFYKVRLSDGSFILYNARSGVKVTKKTVDPAKIEKGHDLPSNFKAAISFDKAREIALAQKTGGTIERIHLETEDGVVVYSVRFDNEARVDVDATTGAVVRTKSFKPDSQTSNPSSGGHSGSSGSGSGNHVSDNSPDAPDAPDTPDSHDDSGSSNSGSGSSGSGR